MMIEVSVLLLLPIEHRTDTGIYCENNFRYIAAYVISSIALIVRTPYAPTGVVVHFDRVFIGYKQRC